MVYSRIPIPNFHLLWIVVGVLAFPWLVGHVEAQVDTDSYAPPSAGVVGKDKGIRIARPGYRYVFPRDHGSHPDYRIEWWYVTGHLWSEGGRRFGYELTFFRRKVEADKKVHSSAWAIDHLYLAHFALTDEQNRHFRFGEKLSRSALGKAGASRDSLNVWIDQWSCRSLNADHSVIRLQAEEETFSLALELIPQKPPVIHGIQGVSRKGPLAGQASHYYSWTRLATQGTLVVDTETLVVKGMSWLDHEFGSGEMGTDLEGWDWFSIQLEDGMEIMLYVLRRENATIDPASSGTVIFSDGTSRHLEWQAVSIDSQDYWVSPGTQARYPAKWQMRVPSLSLTLGIAPIIPNQELVTRRSTQIAYWEGAVNVHGTQGGKSIKGVGYVELTGYDHPLRKTY